MFNKLFINNSPLLGSICSLAHSGHLHPFK
nr:MAG TPA: hypothetical protein [Bacteriophage sp.]